LRSAADAEKILYQVQATGSSSPTDGRKLQINRGGVATGVVSVPLRYMHTPAEVLDLGDLDESVKLMCAYIRRLTPEIDFTPR
jgi:putative aminopeptidase FrvX